jgi:hypothetical protein
LATLPSRPFKVFVITSSFLPAGSVLFTSHSCFSTPFLALQPLNLPITASILVVPLIFPAATDDVQLILYFVSETSKLVTAALLLTVNPVFVTSLAEWRNSGCADASAAVALAASTVTSANPIGRLYLMTFRAPPGGFK